MAAPLCRRLSRHIGGGRLPWQKAIWWDKAALGNGHMPGVDSRRRWLDLKGIRCVTNAAPLSAPLLNVNTRAQSNPHPGLGSPSTTNHHEVPSRGATGTQPQRSSSCTIVRLSYAPCADSPHPRKGVPRRDRGCGRGLSVHGHDQLGSRSRFGVRFKLSRQHSKYQGGRHLFLIHLDLFSMPPLALYGIRSSRRPVTPLSSLSSAIPFCPRRESICWLTFAIHPNVRLAMMSESRSCRVRNRVRLTLGDRLGRNRRAERVVAARRVL